MSVWSAMDSQFCVRPTSKRWFLRIVQVTMNHVLVDAVKICHVDFASIFRSHTYSGGPSSVVWSELGPAPPFPMRMVMGSQCHMWSGPKCWTLHGVNKLSIWKIRTCMFQDDPKLMDDGGEIPKSQGRGWPFEPRLWNLLSTRHKTC